MRHRISGRKLGRSSSHRRALMRTMVTQLLENERLVTTVTRAKEVRPIAEKMITLGKREHLHARRKALSFLRKKSVVHKLFDSLAPRFADRHGGYTRIIRLGARKGDNAELALLELADGEVTTTATDVKQAKEARKTTKKSKAKVAQEKADEKTAKPREEE